MTNREYLNEVSDEDLAKLLISVGTDGHSYGYWILTNSGLDFCEDAREAMDRTIAWLKSEQSIEFASNLLDGAHEV